MDEECVILDLPEGLRLNLLGLIVEIESIRIVADRAGLLGGLVASLTCGGVESAERLEALAQMIRSQEQGGGGATDEQQPEEEQEPRRRSRRREPEEEEEPRQRPRRRREE